MRTLKNLLLASVVGGATLGMSSCSENSENGNGGGGAVRVPGDFAGVPPGGGAPGRAFTAAFELGTGISGPGTPAPPAA